MTDHHPSKPSALGLSLGMGANIERRDVIRGLGVFAAGSLLAPTLAKAEAAANYPPALTGLRGSTDAAFKYAHALRDGEHWSAARSSDEPYDLVIVGGGISGLSAAYMAQKRLGASARILILDNHDDYGGHARRNEHHFEGKTYISPGGSVMVGGNKRGRDLTALIDFDVDMLRQKQGYDVRINQFGLKPSIYFDQKTFGVDKTIVSDALPLSGQDEAGRFKFLSIISELPLSANAKGELKRFFERRDDVLAGKSDREKAAYLTTISYDKFVTGQGGLSREAADFLVRYPSAIMACTADCLSALACMQKAEMPGLQLLGDWGQREQARLNAEDKEPSIGLAGPEGNGIIARTLVYRMMPHACQAASLEAFESGRVNYALLDVPGKAVRLRLNSTVVNVREEGGAYPVKVTYANAGGAHVVEAKKCVMASYNMMIPYIIPTLSAQQKAALSYNVKVPMIAASVLLRNGRSFQDLGSASFFSPGRLLHEHFGWATSFGSHEQVFDSSQPTIMYMLAPPIQPHSGMPPRDQYRAARAELLGKPFSAYEFEIREHLQGLFKQTGFKAEQDVVSLTVNRWGHGYSYELNPLFDPEFPPGELPYEVARQRFGSIAIANSDSTMAPHAVDAINQAHRAVEELML